MGGVYCCMIATKQIDWDAVSAIAASKTVAEIRFTIQDIMDTLIHSDALDVLDGGNRGGYYRDESSIYRKELRKRLAQGAK